MAKDENAGKSYHNGKIPIVHYPYVVFTLNNNESFVQNPGDKRPDYFISLEHKRYVSQANLMTINITYVPKGNGVGGDPNRLENSMRTSGGIFRVKYGMTKDTTLMSPEYIGMIYNYSVSIQDGAISYSISAVSRTVIANYDNLKDNKLGINCQSDENGTPVTTTDNAKSVLDKMEKVVSTTSLGKVCEFDKKNSDMTFNVTKTLEAAGMVPMQYLMTIAATLVDKSNPKENFYKIVVSDVGTTNKTKSKIRLVRTSNTEVGSYVFQWGGKNTDVLSWKPDYQGAFAIFNNNESSGFANYVSPMSLDVGGNVVGAQIKTIDQRAWITQADKELASTASTSLSQSATLALDEVQNFKENAEYPYKATLTVLGIGGDELTLGRSLIEVNPIINGVPHYSAGTYTVIGVTDNVSNSGFTTTLDLYRYVKVEGGYSDLGTADTVVEEKSNTSTGTTYKINPDGTKVGSKESAKTNFLTRFSNFLAWKGNIDPNTNLPR